MSFQVTDLVHFVLILDLTSFSLLLRKRQRWKNIDIYYLSISIHGFTTWLSVLSYELIYNEISQQKKSPNRAMTNVILQDEEPWYLAIHGIKAARISENPKNIEKADDNSLEIGLCFLKIAYDLNTFLFCQHLTAIAVERFVSVKYPFKSRIYLTRKVSKCVVFVLWTEYIVLFIILGLLETYKWYQIPFSKIEGFTILSLLVPSVTNYFFILWKVKKQNRQVQKRTQLTKKLLTSMGISGILTLSFFFTYFLYSMTLIIPTHKFSKRMLTIASSFVLFDRFINGSLITVKCVADFIENRKNLKQSNIPIAARRDSKKQFEDEFYSVSCTETKVIHANNSKSEK